MRLRTCTPLFQDFHLYLETIFNNSVSCLDIRFKPGLKRIPSTTSSSHMVGFWSGVGLGSRLTRKIVSIKLLSDAPKVMIVGYQILLHMTYILC